MSRSICENDKLQPGVILTEDVKILKDTELDTLALQHVTCRKQKSKLKWYYVRELANFVPF